MIIPLSGDVIKGSQFENKDYENSVLDMLNLMYELRVDVP